MWYWRQNRSLPCLLALVGLVLLLAGVAIWLSVEISDDIGPGRVPNVPYVTGPLLLGGGLSLLFGVPLYYVISGVLRPKSKPVDHLSRGGSGEPRR